MGSSRFLDLVAERVVVYDGAFGTYMQQLDLTADDFGGHALEGCNEMLVLTRPDLVSQMHDDFFKVGADVVETATFGAFAIPLAEYDIAEQAFEINAAAARIAREVAERARRRWWPARSAPARSSPRCSRSASPTCATPTRCRWPGCSRAAASTCCSSRPSSTSSASRPR